MWFSLKPRFVSRPWGGSRLAERFGASVDEPIGEVWLIYDENEIADGPYAGRKLRDVLPRIGRELLGDAVYKRYGPELPLLVKLLETSAWLSVQVHPDDAYAHSVEAHTGFHGKDEAWVILEAEPEAKIIYGVRRRVSREELLDALRDGSVLELLNFVSVEPGDVIYIPAGTIHALGPSLLVYEVQQRSDLTYRLYDHGRGRELHLEKALDVAVLEPQPVKKKPLAAGRLLETAHFSLDCFVGGSVHAPRESFLALVQPGRSPSGLVLGAGGRLELEVGLWLVASAR